MIRRQKKVSSSKPRLFYIPCDSHQAGSLIYTNRLYSKLDPDHAFPKWIRWLKIRNNWIAQQESIQGKGNLTCVICGKTGLKKSTKTKSEMATIDHIKPVSVFPELWNVPSNFQITCYKCNQIKGCSH